MQNLSGTGLSEWIYEERYIQLVQIEVKDRFPVLSGCLTVPQIQPVFNEKLENFL